MPIGNKHRVKQVWLSLLHGAFASRLVRPVDGKFSEKYKIFSSPAHSKTDQLGDVGQQVVRHYIGDKPLTRQGVVAILRRRVLEAIDPGLVELEPALVGIDVAHVEGPDADGVGILHIPSSKTDQAKEGAQAYLSSATMAAIARSRAASGACAGRCCAGW